MIVTTIKQYFVLYYLILFTFLGYTQKGKDGNVIYDGALQNIVIPNRYSYLKNNVTGGDGYIVVNDINDLNGNTSFPNSINSYKEPELKKGDLVFIIQTQGADMDISNTLQYGTITNYNHTGNYELLEVESVSGDTIKFFCGLPAKNYQTTGRCKSVVVRVPRFSTLTLSSGVTLSGLSWNGKTGGMIILEIENDFIIEGIVSANGIGFRRGIDIERNNTCWDPNLFPDFLTQSNNEAAGKGESVVGNADEYTLLGGKNGRGAPGNGGGGGFCHNGGGGGGSNAGINGSITGYNGTGIKDTSISSWIIAWELESPGLSKNISPGGGRGGYSYSKIKNDPLLIKPDSSIWDGNHRRIIGGWGGHPLDYSGDSFLFMGGGGGAGEGNNGCGGDGGNGGGIIFIVSGKSINGNGKIEANGEKGQNTLSCAIDAAGGGGGGGAIIVQATNISNGIAISANGGIGGNQIISSDEAEGPGAGGGGGYILINSPVTNLSVDGGKNGTTNSKGIIPFSANGATMGADGTIVIKTIDFSISSIGLSIVSSSICNGSCEGSANAIITGGSPLYKYNWSDGQTNNPAINLCAGTYFLTITDSKGCTATDSILVNESTPIILTTSVTDAVCGQCDGKGTVTPTGGTPPYTYKWDATAGNQTTQTVNTLCPGTYSITVSDHNGCTKTTTIHINTSNGPSLSSLATNVNCYGNSTGNINLAITGGTSPFNFIWTNGATTEDLNNIPAGIYFVTVTDKMNCKAFYTVTVTEPTLLETTITGTNLTCYQNNTGIANISATEGTPGYTYLWNTGNSTTTINNLEAGIYTVTVTDANNCTKTDQIMITEPPILTITQQSQPAKCYGVCDGSSNVVVSGGTSPYTYKWSNNQTTNPATNLCAGIYTVTATDSHGCTITINTTITQPTQVTLMETHIDENCGQCNGSATVTPTGGTQGYSYLWDTNNITTPIATNLCMGSYTVTVTDANNCTAEITIIIGSIPGFTMTIAGTPASCNGVCDGAINLGTTNAPPPVTYIWSNGFTTEDLTNLCDGKYDVTITDGNGCKGTNTFTITEPPAIIITTPVTTNISCNGVCDGSVSTIASGGTQPLEYSLDGTTYQSTGNFTNLCDGNYTITVRDANGCINTIVFTIIEPPVLMISETHADALCYNECNGTATITAQGGASPYTIKWSDGSNTNFARTDLCDGVYTVTVSDSHGCTVTLNITINEPMQVMVMVSGVDENCKQCNGIAIATPSGGGTPPYTYQWSNKETTSQIQNLCEGTYSVTVKDINGCAANGTVIINNIPGFTSVITGTDVTCYGLSDGILGMTITGGQAPFNYLWQPGGDTNQNPGGLPANTYKVTITDSKGCTGTDSYTINQPDSMTVSIADVNTICIGQCTTLTATAKGGDGGYTYLWSEGNGQSIQVCPTVSTTGYKVTATDSKGCTATANIGVEVYPPLVITLSTQDDTLCPGDCTDIMITVSGGMGSPYTLTQQDGQVITSMLYHVCPAVTTTYTITAKDGCTTPSVSSEITIYVEPLPQVFFDANKKEGCVPLTVQFNETNDDLGQTYLWDFGDTYGNNSSTEKNPKHTFKEPGTYTITCNIVSAAGCKNSLTIKDMITVYPNPVASFLAHPQVTTILNPLVEFENTSSTFNKSLWEFGDEDSSNVTHPQHKYSESGTYKVKLYVETEHGCPDETEMEVIIQDIHTFYAPDIFTPDWDNINQLFSPIGIGIDKNHWDLRVYDRWGELVFETNIYDVDENGRVKYGWDGRIKGKDIGENAVYVWLCIYRDFTGKEHTRSGNVNLLR